MTDRRSAWGGWLAALPFVLVMVCAPAHAGDGSGLSHDQRREIFEKAGHRVDVSYQTYSRCRREGSRKTGCFDAFAGGYDGDGGLTLKWHLGVELLTAAYPVGYMLSDWPGQELLKGTPLTGCAVSNLDKSDRRPVEILNNGKQRLHASGPLRQMYHAVKDYS